MFKGPVHASFNSTNNLKNIIQKIGKVGLIEWFFIGFSIIWIFILTLDFWNKHPLYKISIEYFRYPNLTIFFVLTGLVLVSYYKRISIFKRVKKPYLSGLLVLFLSLVIIVATTASFNKYWNAPLDATNYFFICGLSLYIIFAVVLLLLAALSVGRFMRSRLVELKAIPLTVNLVDLCLGLFIVHLILFALGAFNLLNQWIVLIFLFALTAIGYRNSFQIVKSILFKPIPVPKRLTALGVFLFWALLVMVVLHFMFVLSPFPLGYDARNYYMNISKLIGESGGLVSGYQPYAWGLMQSVGYIAFKNAGVAMFISTVGGILTFFAMFNLMVDYLKISINYTALSMLLFAGTPAVANHWIIEYKIDLALLFTQLVAIVFFIHWLKKKKKQSKLIESRTDLAILGIIGVFLGFGLAIKGLALFMLIGITTVLWAFNGDNRSTLGVSMMGLGMVLLLGLDNPSGLRSYHSGIMMTVSITVGTGLVLMLISLLKNRGPWIDSLKASLVVLGITIASFSPWMVKNYVQASRPSFSKLIIGENPGPEVTIADIISRYRAIQKQDSPPIE